MFALPRPDVEGGDWQARDALAAFFNSYLNPVHAVKPEHIVLTAGGSDAIESILYAVCNDGDSVIIPGPYWRKLCIRPGLLVQDIMKFDKLFRWIRSHPQISRKRDAHNRPAAQLPALGQLPPPVYTGSL